MNPNQPLDPPKSPLEKLVTARRSLIEPVNMARYVRDLPAGMGQALVKAMAAYDRDSGFKMQRYLDEFESWANIHTHREVEELALPGPFALYLASSYASLGDRGAITTSDTWLDEIGGIGNPAPNNNSHVYLDNAFNGQPGVQAGGFFSLSGLSVPISDFTILIVSEFYSGSGDVSFQMFTSSDGILLRFESAFLDQVVLDVGPDTISQEVPFPPADPTPYFLVGRKIGNEIKMWLNGVEVASGTSSFEQAASETLFLTCTSAVVVGEEDLGSTQEFRFWDFALSDEQVTEAIGAYVQTRYGL